MWSARDQLTLLKLNGGTLVSHKEERTLDHNSSLKGQYDSGSEQ